MLGYESRRLPAALGLFRKKHGFSTALARVRGPLMATVSKAGPTDGTRVPSDVEVYRVTPEENGHMAPHERPTVVVMWHGNGYKRADCWIQIDEDSACILDYWL